MSNIRLIMTWIFFIPFFAPNRDKTYEENIFSEVSNHQTTLRGSNQTSISKQLHQKSKIIAVKITFYHMRCRVWCSNLLSGILWIRRVFSKRLTWSESKCHEFRWSDIVLNKAQTLMNLYCTNIYKSIVLNFFFWNMMSIGKKHSLSWNEWMKENLCRLYFLKKILKNVIQFTL